MVARGSLTGDSVVGYRLQVGRVDLISLLQLIYGWSNVNMRVELGTVAVEITDLNLCTYRRYPLYVVW